MKKYIKVLIIFFGVFITVVLLIIGLCSWDFTRDRLLVYTQSPYKTFISPDKQFILAVYITSAVYGIRVNADDYVGVVILRDKEGNILNSCDVEPIGLIDHASWAPDRVRVALIINWDLPRRPVQK